IDPYGNQVFSAGFGTVNSDVDVQTLAAAGTYTLLLEGGVSGTGTGAYTINVQPAPVSTTPLALGQTVSAAIATPGDSDRYTFTRARPPRLYFDPLNNNATFNWPLTGPAGTAVNVRPFTASDGGSVSGSPVLSLAAGDYALTVDAPGDATGAY